MRLNLSCFLFLASCYLVGCNSSQTGDPVVGVEDTDASMNAAMETAKQTFPLFVDRWQSMASDSVGVKISLPTTDGAKEHIWFEPTEISGTQITGVCANAPNKIADLKLGDERTFNQSEITDWMILVGNRCYGGYTIRVLSEMEPENAPPFTFHDFETTE